MEPNERGRGLTWYQQSHDERSQGDYTELRQHAEHRF